MAPPQQVVLASRIVLAAASGQSDSAIARLLETNRKTVMLWRARFGAQGLKSLWEVAPGRGRKPTYDLKQITAIVEGMTQTFQAVTQPEVSREADRCGRTVFESSVAGSGALRG